MRLRLGFHYTLPESTPWAQAPGDLANAVIEHACLAEAQGFGVIWIVEGTLQPCAPLCAAAAMATERLRVCALWRHWESLHPLRLAEDAATLDGAAGGRLEVGLGVEEPSDRLDEVLTLLAESWRDGPLRHRGKLFSEGGLEVIPKPAQHPGPPLWLAGEEACVALAARHDCGLWTRNPQGSPGLLKSWSDSGRDPGEARIDLILEAAPGPSGGVSAAGEALLAQISPPLTELSSAAEVRVLFPGVGEFLSPDRAREELLWLAEHAAAHLEGILGGGGTEG